jgi:ribose 5-phosphate isomerase B
MKIVIGSDHGGYLLKQKLISYLKSKNHNILDVGCFNQESCDYPQYALKVATLVSKKIADRGIVICKSGIGNSIVANKVKGARAALCYNVAQAKSSRKHNDANILVLGALYTKYELAKKMVSAWINTKAKGGRHARRIKQIMEIEKKLYR